MCNLLLLTGERFYQIIGGIVYSRSTSGDHRDTVCWPIADFRRLCEEAPRIVAAFDAESAVLMFQRE